MSRDFSVVTEKAAWDLHREFHQDMRNLREEEYKLADLYMKVTTFTGGALVLVMTRIAFSGWLVVLVTMSLLFFLGLLLIFAARIRGNHATYRELGKWVVDIRRHHAGGVFSEEEHRAFGEGGGYRRQLYSLVWCWISVTMIVSGCLVMCACGVMRP